MTLITLLLFEIFQLEFLCQNRKQPEVQPDHPPGIRRFRVDILNMYDRRFRLYFDQFAVSFSVSWNQSDSIPFWTILISISLPPFLNFICTDGQMSETEGRGWAAGLQTYTSYVCTLNILCFPAWKNKTSFDRWTLLK